MTDKLGGWAGKVLRVNLTTGNITTESTNKYHDYIGGMGIGYKILWDGHKDNIKATDPENIIVFSAGPLTGSGVICTGRTTITSRSPVIKDHLISDGHFGGHFSPAMKYAGFDAIAIEGRAAAPVWLRVEDGKVTLESAAALWGKGIFDTHAMIAEMMGPNAQVAAIGQAGENQVPLSVIMTQGGHSAGGHGAVLGSKNFKGIGIIGTGAVAIAADNTNMRRLDDHILGIIGANNQGVVPSTPQSWAEYSNSGSRWKARPGLKWGQSDQQIELGEVPWNERNKVGFRTSMAEMYFGEEYANKWMKRTGGCHACPIRCFCELKVPELKQKYGRKSEHISNVCMGFLAPQYLMDTKKGSEEHAMTGALGGNLIDDYGIWCNYGLISHLFKYLKKHDMFQYLLPKEEFDSIPWDLWDKKDPAFLIDFYRRIAYREGEIAHMADGMSDLIDRWKLDGRNPDLGYWDIHKESSVKIFNKKTNAAVHHASETAGQVGTLINMVFNRDAQCHSHINIVNCGLPQDMIETIAAEFWGEGAFDKVKWYTPINPAKVKFAKWSLVKNVLHDSLTLCNWMFPLLASPDKNRNYRGDSTIESQMFSLVTGKEVTETELDFMAERVLHLHRALTIIQMNEMNMRNEHDVLCDWVYDLDPDKAFGDEGTIKMDRDDIQKALDMFYDDFGWDRQTGAPLRSTLEKFGLGYAADALEARGLLPG
ncbi:aldehyde ferredoxin oxidoreductase [Shewanella algae]|uniref:aldehyde ferredoxin oxidoreductase n=1 Tax=Shewanella algae TaxID=38313 RepID=UPI001AAC5E9A|nr:aldehyde ferredoxin oxidoreductase [Shewanella algae]MBO2603915.1 aldehyde ferredoxin oxidoreductase [Shewanella algae]